MLAVSELVARLAAMTAVALDDIAPAMAVKLAVVLPGAIVTAAGTASSGVPLESITDVPPLGAGALKATVQVLEPPEERPPEPQPNEARLPEAELPVPPLDACRISVAPTELPPKVALSIAVPGSESNPSIAV